MVRMIWRVTHDYVDHVMEFQVDGELVKLVYDKSLVMKRITFNQLQAMTETDDFYGIYEVHFIQEEIKKSPNELVLAKQILEFQFTYPKVLKLYC